MANPETTRYCPKCESSCLCKMHGQSLKICYDCGHEFHWPLDAGQKPIFEGTVPDSDLAKELVHARA